MNPEAVFRALAEDLLGFSVPVLTLDQLIRAKSVLQQSKDRQHLDQLLQVRRLREGGGE